MLATFKKGVSDRVEHETHARKRSLVQPTDKSPPRNGQYSGGNNNVDSDGIPQDWRCLFVSIGFVFLHN